MSDSLLAQLDALLITHPLNIRYLTDFAGLAPSEREAYVLVTGNKNYLFTSALYLEQVRKLADNHQLSAFRRKMEVIEISQESPLAKKLKSCLDALKQGRTLKPITLGFEEADLTVAEFNRLNKELAEYELVPTHNRVEELRKIKRPDEIVHIRRAAKLTDRCFAYILKKLKVGVTETEISWEIESYFRKHDAESAFSPIVAFNQNSSQPHYSSSASCKLMADSLILLDFGARVAGYCADMTRVVFVDNPTSEQKKVYETLKNAQEKALTLLQNGERSGAILDQSARDVLTKSGFPPYPHSLGHAAGLAIHERPRLTMKRDETLQPGMVVTVEPGVYLEGKFGVRIEDLVLIKENGIEILSRSSKDLLVL